MWSDELNKKIQEGENRNLPNYSESDWEKMETLLNKHLPQERKKRRGLILFLLPLLLASGIILINWPLGKQASAPVTVNETSQSQSSPPTNNEKETDSRSSNTDLPAGNVKAKENADPSGNIALKETTAQEKTSVIPVERISRKENSTVTAEVGSNRKTSEKPRVSEHSKRKKAMTENPPLAFKTPVIEQNKKPSAIEPDDKNNTEETRDIARIDPANSVSKIDSDSLPAENKVDSVDNENEEQPSPVIPRKRSRGSRLALHLAMGPDISMVGFDRPGRVQLQYGLGISYDISSRLSVRTGFFAGDKVYSASPDDYKVPYPIHDLEKVDADCYIYEIPVGLLYTFNPGNKNKWMAGASVSSYIMKKETYGYHYRNYSGQPQYYKRSYSNENKHLFSVLTLSGGYRHQLTNRLSLMTEPYIKLPLGGVGVGKVKLNNAGVMFSIGYKPFLRK